MNSIFRITFNHYYHVARFRVLQFLRLFPFTAILNINKTRSLVRAVQLVSINSIPNIMSLDPFPYRILLLLLYALSFRIDLATRLNAETALTSFPLMAGVTRDGRPIGSPRYDDNIRDQRSSSRRSRRVRIDNQLARDFRLTFHCWTFDPRGRFERAINLFGRRRSDNEVSRFEVSFNPFLDRGLAIMRLYPFYPSTRESSALSRLSMKLPNSCFSLPSTGLLLVYRETRIHVAYRKFQIDSIFSRNIIYTFEMSLASIQTRPNVQSVKRLETIHSGVEEASAFRSNFTEFLLSRLLSISFERRKRIFDRVEIAGNNENWHRMGD